MGTNKPVKITDAKSGIIRRLIDVHPTGNKFQPNHYNTLMAQIDFELGAIAQHCLEVYREMGKNYYNTYRPTRDDVADRRVLQLHRGPLRYLQGSGRSDPQAGVRLYKEYCSETGIEFVLPQYKFREELRNYFDEFPGRGINDRWRQRFVATTLAFTSQSLQDAS